MRLLALDLRAYGPFSGRRLDLSGGREGLHLVFGPNEAGKSSALRAIRALLYGIPRRTSDGFIHPGDQLRIGGRLRLRDGSELAFLRRKGTRGTLLSWDEKTQLADTLLDRCLHGVEEEAFAAVFGIGHDALVAGGRALLEQKGDVGQALFAAGTGTRNLRQVLRELDAEAAELFLPRGSRPRINQALSELREARRVLAEEAKPARLWTDHQEALEAATRELGKVEAELRQVEGETARLRRLQRVLPLLAERRELLRRREEMGEVVVLSEEWSGRRREASDAAREAGRRLALGRERRARLVAQAAELGAADDLLARASGIEQLQEKLGSHRKATADRSRLEGEIAELRAGATELLADLQPGLLLGEAESLRPGLERWRRIQDLAQRHPALLAARIQARKEALAAERELADVLGAQGGLRPVRDCGPLRRAIEAVRRAGDLDAAIAEAGESLRRQEEELASGMGRLGLWTGTPEELEALPAPGEASIEACQDELSGLAERAGRLEEGQAAARQQLSDAERLLEELRRTGEVPTEADLARARERRERLWSLVRRAWLDGEPPPAPGALALLAANPANLAGTAEAAAFAPGEELPAAYERSVSRADELADRLRREAGRVQVQAEQLARRGELESRLAGLEAERQAIAGERERAERRWRELWRPCGISPLSPREMHPGWTSRLARLRDQAARLRELRREAASRAAAVAGHRHALSRELAVLGEAVDPGERLGPQFDPGERLQPQFDPGERPAAQLDPGERLQPQLDAGERLALQLDLGERLQPLLAHAEGVMQRIEAEERERRTLEERSRSLRDRLGQARDGERLAEEGLGQWQEIWGETVKPLNLDAGALPGEAVQRLEDLRGLFAKLSQVAERERRMQGIERDAADFRGEVASLARGAAPDLLALPAQQGAAQLAARLTAARGRATLRAQLGKQIEELDAEVLEAEVALQAAGEQLAELAQAAGCGRCEVGSREEDEKMAAAERLSGQWRELTRALDACESRLLAEGEGTGLEELAAEAVGVASDDLAGRLAQAELHRAELMRRYGDAREAQGRELRELASLDGGDRAADAAAKVHETLARLGGLAHRYRRLRLASHVLSQEIERYRRDNQEPVLRSAGEIFSRLTLGSFEGLQADLDERDEPVLVGLRAGAGRVGVEGMSSGTRDQLYLALRLATLERHLAQAEPLPFIVDDVLINFDDARSAAALEVLGDLAARTQVILFSHHARLRELAGHLHPPAGVFIQDLSLA